MGAQGRRRLVGKLLVAVKPFGGIHAAGQSDHRIGAGFGAANRQLASCGAEHEEHPLARVRICVGPGLGGRQRRGDLLRQCLGLAGHPERVAYGVDLGGDGGAIESAGNLDKIDVGGAQHIEGFGRAGALGREDQRRPDRQHGFRRQGAHIAHVGQGARRFGPGRGAVACQQPVALVQRIDDFGHVAADRQHPGRRQGLGGRLICAGRPGREDTGGRHPERHHGAKALPFHSAASVARVSSPATISRHCGRLSLVSFDTGNA